MVKGGCPLQGKQSVNLEDCDVISDTDRILADITRSQRLVGPLFFAPGI